MPIADADVSNLLERMAAADGNTYAGCWDVVAWRGERVVFMELKRRRKDRVQETQLAWVEAGIKIGLGVESFLFVEWEECFKVKS